MPFAYCGMKNCELSLNAPTAREDIQGEWKCPAGHIQPRYYTNEEWIILLYDNIIDLTKQIEEKLW